MRRFLSLADDLTGALEVGARWASAGAPALVTMSFGPEQRGGDALSLDTETRHVTPGAAYRTTRETVALALEAGFTDLYQKTDSTLRGNIPAQFRALLDACPERLLVYAPGYPELGRVVQGGILRVDGAPLAETAFASDAREPSRESSVPALLRAGLDSPIHVVSSAAGLQQSLAGAPDGSVLVCDAATNADLHTVAAELRGCTRSVMVAGTGIMAEIWGHGILPLTVKRPPQFRTTRWLILCGSRHPVSLSQVRWAQEAGCECLELAAHPGQDEAAVQAVVSSLETGGWTAVSSPAERLDDPGLAALRLARLCRDVLARTGPAGLIVLGGDTAFHLMQTLGIESIAPCLELLPGVPLSRIDTRWQELPLVTKAGGFGRDNVLGEIRRKMEEIQCSLP